MVTAAGAKGWDSLYLMTFGTLLMLVLPVPQVEAKGASGEGSTAALGPMVLEMELTEFTIKPSTLEVPAGTAVSIKV